MRHTQNVGSENFRIIHKSCSFARLHCESEAPTQAKQDSSHYKLLRENIMKKLIGVCLLLFSAASFAAEKDIVIPELIQKLLDDGAELHKKFKISENLNGFAMTMRADQRVIYATADGQYLLSGDLLNNNAKNMTKEYEDKYIPKSDYTSTISAFETAAGFPTHDKKAERTLYILHDPNCPYCKRAFDQIMSMDHKSGVKVKWVPVAALGQNSLQKGSALLSSIDPVRMQRDFDKGRELNKLEILGVKKYNQKVTDNTKLLGLIGASDTPAMIVVNKDKEIENIIYGFRPDQIEKVWK